ncbi:YkuS family protein [Evansella sp. AB-rgal1]|uniref:YkuS family protein n=1 Tax=Evansella sp. AB-rgal1 TaxID=3242696 RepID=UPI00359DFAF6
MAKVGVEQSLTDVQQALQEKGYDVIQLNQEQDAAGCDCCVITGQDRNVMGMQDTTTEAPIIDAHGRTAEEICQEVEQKINQQQ